MLVEFRHRSWLDDDNRAETLSFLERIGAAYVTVDAPRSDTAKNLVPTVPAVTSDTAYVRFHGRNIGTWNKRGGSAAERFDYLYSDAELEEWAPTLKELAGAAKEVYALFNNNATSDDPENPLGRVSQAATNARQLRLLLDGNGVAASGGASWTCSRSSTAPMRARSSSRRIVDGGHRLDEWSFSWGSPPPRPLESYDAFLVFGGAMHADHDDSHPWLSGDSLARDLVADGRPVLGICLGVQLLARAAGAWVGPLPEPEIGWFDVEVNDAGAADPVLGALPRRFSALQWHHYTYGVPEGAVELARSPSCTQAFRLGDAAGACSSIRR